MTTASVLRFAKRYPLPIIVGGGLVAGLVVRFAVEAPNVARWTFLATLVAGGGPLVLQTLRGMLRSRFAADIAAMLAIVTAFVFGQYFAGAVIALMQSGGEAKLYACRASVDMFGLKQQDFLDTLEGILTVGEFYEKAAGGQIIFT